MLEGIRRRFTYANVAATLALVLALGGAAWAAFQLPRNSVRSMNIKNGQVKARDIGNNQVRSSDIKNGQVKSEDIKDGDVSSSDIGAGQVKSANIGNSEVSSANIGAGQVKSANIGSGQVGADQLAQPEPFNLVGTDPAPLFGTGGANDCLWSNFSSGTVTPNSPFNPVGFYKDPYGVVHLTGAAESQDGPGGDTACGGIDNGADQRVFTLPAAYQPPHLLSFAVTFGSSSSTGQLDINGPQIVTEGTATIPPGAVYFATGTGSVTRLSLDGVDFRAAGPGTGIASTR
jgi:hypothetical protein